MADKAVSTKSSSATIADRLYDFSYGPIATAYDLVTHGALVVDTPPRANQGNSIDFRTIIQIDGDVINFVRDESLVDRVDEHFSRVRRRLMQIRKLSEWYLSAFTSVTSSVGLLSGLSSVWGFCGGISLSVVVWLSGICIVMIGLAIARRILAPLMFRRMMNRWQKNNLVRLEP